MDEMKIRLIAFDLDGVLVDGLGSWRELHRALGTEERAMANYKAFYSGEIDFAEWARRDVELWKGVSAERINEILRRIPLMNGAEETLARLNGKYKTAIISGGIQQLADIVKDKLGIDYAIGNRLIFRDGRVSGIKNYVDLHSKGEILRKIAEMNGISTTNCAVIGDYLNDIPMFRVAGFRIAFNPKDEEIKRYADEIIYEKDLRRILRFF
ncbi:MAG: phosphoserine phosphatase SerB [Candidatus Altiarchaeales archaeon]|nr:MAG: phosphoserine phosphatase SerB [Candidatus Altiarchaeales archaeon]RLI94654.1 MAG: phosphoserine phosphatase SerB [Candidatus Altiarchaeales archaeon]HDO82342.1 HAD family hydrolase [Candidatus Altiarchaeales archaeon]HEX54991.1 HAD family hydrolase [Candidatus Altiarchaeales archaeon]